MVKEYLKTEVTTLDVEQTLPKLLKSIQALIEEYGETAEASLGVKQDSEGEVRGYEIVIHACVLETDTQYAKRIGAEDAVRQKVESWERKILERLKAKYPESK